VYAQSKLTGESFVRDFHSKFFIVRTSWVFGVRGNNFVKTMLKLSQATELLMVINDQVGCLTYTVDLSKCIVELMGSNKYGIYHGYKCHMIISHDIIPLVWDILPASFYDNHADYLLHHLEEYEIFLLLADAAYDD
jgi:dTDP-4-dehydrorhamnose reductase